MLWGHSAIASGVLRRGSELRERGLICFDLRKRPSLVLVDSRRFSGACALDVPSGRGVVGACGRRGMGPTAYRCLTCRTAQQGRLLTGSYTGKAHSFISVARSHSLLLMKLKRTPPVSRSDVAGVGNPRSRGAWQTTARGCSAWGDRETRMPVETPQILPGLIGEFPPSRTT